MDIINRLVIVDDDDDGDNDERCSVLVTHSKSHRSLVDVGQEEHVIQGLEASFRNDLVIRLCNFAGSQSSSHSTLFLSLSTILPLAYLPPFSLSHSLSLSHSILSLSPSSSLSLDLSISGGELTTWKVSMLD